jgi:hypothetical protein
MPQFPIFGAHDQHVEIASRLHDQAEFELGLSDLERIRLERLASNLEDKLGAKLIDRLTAGFDQFLNRGGERA